MIDIRCPKCGKIYQPDLTICQFCGAELSLFKDIHNAPKLDKDSGVLESSEDVSNWSHTTEVERHEKKQEDKGVESPDWINTEERIFTGEEKERADWDNATRGLSENNGKILFEPEEEKLDWLFEFTEEKLHEIGSNEKKVSDLSVDNNVSKDGVSSDSFSISDETEESSVDSNLAEEETPNFNPDKPFLRSKRTWFNWDNFLPNELEGGDNSELFEEHRDDESDYVTDWMESKHQTDDDSNNLVTKDLEIGSIEHVGPLAGLRGVLPGNETSTQLNPPPTISLKLNVTDKHYDQVALLESLLTEEQQSQGMLKERAHKSYNIIRLCIALVFIGLLSIPIFTNSHLLTLPEIIPVNVNHFYEIIEKGAEQGDLPVLMAVDIEPGFSGEMDISTTAIIRHLMVKDARLSIISTIPTGPAIAESMLKKTNQYHPNFSLIDKTINLGYLAGGLNSIQEFALNPRLVARFALNSLDLWDQHAALRDIKTIDDYDLIIVLTNSVEKAQAWIEQLQPILGENVPLLMVTSAQIAPMLTPYIDSGQVKGLVAGYSGGLAYEQILQLPSKGRMYWDSYIIGVSLAITLIIFGVIYQCLSTVILKRRTRTRKF